MTLFNRVFIGVLSLLALLVALALFAAPEAVMTAVETAAAALRAQPALSVQLGAAIAVVALVLLLLQLWPGRRRLFEARMDNMTVEYPSRTVVDILQRELVAIDGVREAAAEASGDPRKVDVRARLQTETPYDPQDVAGRAATRIREQLERGMGLGVGQVRISVQPFRDSRPRATEKPRSVSGAGASNEPSTTEPARPGAAPGPGS